MGKFELSENRKSILKVTPVSVAEKTDEKISGFRRAATRH